MALGGDFDQKEARIHAWAFNLCPYDLNRQVTGNLMLNNAKIFTDINPKLFSYGQFENMYLNNRQMSDENRYIFERQKLKEKPVGIILEKPTMLSKRLFI